LSLESKRRKDSNHLEIFRRSYKQNSKKRSGLSKCNFN